MLLADFFDENGYIYPGSGNQFSHYLMFGAPPEGFNTIQVEINSYPQLSAHDVLAEVSQNLHSTYSKMGKTINQLLQDISQGMRLPILHIRLFRSDRFYELADLTEYLESIYDYPREYSIFLELV